MRSIPCLLLTALLGCADLPTTLTPEHLAYLDASRRNGPSNSFVCISKDQNQRAASFHTLVRGRDPAALAQAALAASRGKAPTEDLSALALALLADNGFVFTGKAQTPLDASLRGSDKPDGGRLLAVVLPMVDALAATDTVAAAECLLHIVCEGMANHHLPAGNGERQVPLMPMELAERAASWLDHADPLVRCLADWTISVQVNLAIDQSKKGGWPPGPAPAWYARWLALDRAQYLDLDYLRQAVTLGMHRRGADLVALAADLDRRSAAKAAWSRSAMTPAQAQASDAAIAAMRAARAALAQAPSPTAFVAFRRAARAVVLGCPDIDFEDMVYVVRYSSGHHLQPFVHGTHHRNGGDILVQRGLDPTSPTRPLIEGRLGAGYAEGLDLSWDARQLVFPWPEKNKAMKLRLINLDGQGLTTITDGDANDVDPAWLPDGGVVFGSTRDGVGVTCSAALGVSGPGATWGGQHTNIYRLSPDLKTVTRLTYCKDDDAYPYPLADGRIVFMRWDYQERDVNEVFSLWSINPDGTGSDGYFKTHVPMGTTVQVLRDLRPVPGTTQLVATGSSHYSWREGALVTCDPQVGINDPSTIRSVTPWASPVTFGWFGLQAVEEGGVPVVGGQYAKPFALSTKTFLVSAGYDMPTSCNFAACYVDVWGNRELLHREPTQEVFDIFPVKPRTKPPVLPSTVRRDQDHAVCYLDDVYADLPGIERGRVRWLRICQMLPWVKEIGQEGLQWHPTANPGFRFGYGTCGPVRVVGLVSVESDGSAHFQVPPDCDLYFQALDANFMALQRMRTHVEFKPGEFRGCTGCHETRANAVRAAVYRKSQALAKPAVRPVPPPWGDRTLIDFERHIQPILAQKCVSCHGAEAPKAGLFLTDVRDEHGFLQSYRSMFGLAPGRPAPNVGWGVEIGRADKPEGKGVKPPDHPWWTAMTTGVVVRSGTKGEVTKPLQFGAINCPLVRYTITTPDHRKLLTDDEVQLLSTWADVQVPYFSSYVRAGKRVEVEIPAPFGADRSSPRPILPVR